MLRIADRIQHLVCIVIRKAEARTGALILIIGLYSILQSAGLSDDGDGAEAHGDHLAQTAGLKQRRHQISITSRIDFMGQCIRIINVGRHLVSILPVEMTEHILITFLTVPSTTN